MNKRVLHALLTVTTVLGGCASAVDDEAPSVNVATVLTPKKWPAARGLPFVEGVITDAEGRQLMDPLRSGDPIALCS